MTTADIINSLILGATIVAIILGPVIAVKITRKQDEGREIRQKKLDIYRTLMQTRASRLAVDHVRGLNAVPVEFYEVEAVMKALKAYMNALNAPLPVVDQQERFFEQRNDAFLDLLHEIGAHLGYELDRHELERLSYTPVGIVNQEERQQRAQSMLVEILEGTRPFPVTWMLPATAPNPFPPAPGPASAVPQIAKPRE